MAIRIPEPEKDRYLDPLRKAVIAFVVAYLGEVAVFVVLSLFMSEHITAGEIVSFVFSGLYSVNPRV